MRIQTAADSLLATPDNAASQIEPTDKQRFARLLDAQPENSQAAPDTVSNLHGAAKAQTVLPSTDVNTDATKPKTKPDAPQTTAVTPASAQAEVAAATSTPAPAALIAAGATSKAAELPDVASDVQLEFSDEQAGKAVPPSATTPVTTNADNTKALLAQLASVSTQSSQTPTAPALKSPAAVTARPELIPNAVLSPALQKNTADSDALAESGRKPLTGPVDKTAQKSRSTRDAHALAASIIAKPDSQAAPDANPATQSLNQQAAKDDESRTADNGNAAAVTNQPYANAAAPNAPQPVVAATNLSMTMQDLPNDTSLPVSKATGSNNTVAMRGAKLPPGGKSLPSSAEAADASSQSPLLHAFKELVDATAIQNPMQAADTSVLQTNQNALNAAAGNLQALASTTAQQQAANSAVNTLSAASVDTAAVANSNDNPVQVPLAFASGLAMSASGWGEETAHHIRWLKDHDQQSAEIQLHPAELGRLSISIDIKDGKASVQMTAGNAEARALLEKSLPDLRDMLAQSGMSLADSSVAQHGGQQHLPHRFNPMWFEADDLKPVELTTGKPALFRSAGGSHRIDQYV